MDRSDAFEIARLLDEIVRGRQGASLFHGEEPTNICLLWIQEFMWTGDAALATTAVAALFTDQTEIPNVAAYRDIIRKLKRDARIARFAVAEEDALGTPAWVVGKLIALSANDHRVWVEQKPGYDALQEANPHSRDYVWGDQTQIPQEARDAYIARATDLSSAEISDLLRTVTGSDQVSALGDL